MSDEILYQKYVQGDASAADILVKQYAESLVLYIEGYIGDYHDAEDLMIEAFAQIFAKARPIHEDGCFKAYLYKTGKNLACRYKKKQKRIWFSFEELTFELQDVKENEKIIFKNEQNKQLYLALKRIKKEYQEALFLVYFEGMKYTDAAHIMGKSVAQITNLVFRGKKSLKSVLEQEGFEYEVG